MKIAHCHSSPCGSLCNCLRVWVSVCGRNHVLFCEHDCTHFCCIHTCWHIDPLATWLCLLRCINHLTQATVNLCISHTYTHTYTPWQHYKSDLFSPAPFFFSFSLAEHVRAVLRAVFPVFLLASGLINMQTIQIMTWVFWFILQHLQFTTRSYSHSKFFIVLQGVLINV